MKPWHSGIYSSSYLNEGEDHTAEAPSLRIGRLSGPPEIKRIARAIAVDEIIALSDIFTNTSIIAVEYEHCFGLFNGAKPPQTDVSWAVERNGIVIVRVKQSTSMGFSLKQLSFLLRLANSFVKQLVTTFQTLHLPTESEPTFLHKEAPPPIVSTCPFIHSPSWLHKKATTRETSSGSPTRFKGDQLAAS